MSLPLGAPACHGVGAVCGAWPPAHPTCPNQATQPAHPSTTAPGPAANLVFWTVALKGSFAIFWLIYFVTLSTGIGEGAKH